MMATDKWLIFQTILS